MVTSEERKELNDIDITIDCESCRIHLDELTDHITASFPGGIEGQDGIRLYTVTLCVGAWTIGNNHGTGHVDDHSPVDGRPQSLTAHEGRKELQIFPFGGIWYVNHLVDGNSDAEITELFNGESFLPTPFMTVIRLQEVVSALVTLNPGKKVSIAVAAVPFCHGLTCDQCGQDFNVPKSDKLEYFADPTKPVNCGSCLSDRRYF